MEVLTQSASTLTDLLDRSARQWPDRTAVEELAGDQMTYAELRDLAARTAHYLRENGVRRGDRVGIYMGKSIDAVAAIFGVLEAGAAYVPVDAASPSWRAAYILRDCSVRAVILETRLEPALRAGYEEPDTLPGLIRVEAIGGGRGLAAALGDVAACAPATAERAAADDLAYILYTSGSTGKPKGVMLTHHNALSFVDWCTEVLEPRPDDRFSSHAPLHFDLSILDLYVPLRHGAAVLLIDSAGGKEPVGLAALISERRLTVWYSTPSILSMLVQYGKMHRHSYESLRAVLFAGEIFPVKYLRMLRSLLPRADFLNLYGPTETNVCTWFRIPESIPGDRTDPYPIGQVCSHLRARIVDGDGDETDGEGELCIAGSAVMRGYWNLPDQTARAFLTGTDGSQWYHTGDIVARDGAGDLIFVGRRDRMVKRRGYRIELGEVEAGLYRHPQVREAAVAAAQGADGTLITAFLSCRAPAPTTLEMRKFCAETLPASMIPDRFVFHDALPKTSTDKLDYQSLMAEL